MVLPNFLVIGAIKAGSTALHRYLGGHPQVFMPEVKEPNFFTAEHNWHLGIHWYEQLFREAGDAVALGEASVVYTVFPTFRDVPLRISQVLPDVRMIYLVRHPIDRMISHLWMDVRRGNLRIRTGEEVESFEQALLTKPRFVNASCYSMQIEQYFDHFPRERILVVKSEELRSQRTSTLERIYEFIGVDPRLMPAEAGREWNKGEDQQKKKRRLDGVLRSIPAYGLLARMSPESVGKVKRRLVTREFRRPTISSVARRELEDRVRDDVRRLRDYVGPNFDGWGIA